MPRWKMPTVSSQTPLVPAKEAYMLAGTPGNESQHLCSTKPSAEERGNISIFPVFNMRKLRQ